MKKFLPIFAVLAIFCFGCKSEVKVGDEIVSGSISGKAYFENSVSNEGITVTLEKTDGLKALSVARMIEGTSGVRSASSEKSFKITTTDSEGNYSFQDVSDGVYTVCAISSDTVQKAVKVNVIVANGNKVLADDLVLTVTGNIKGKVILDDSEDRNYGFVVYIAGTSYSAMTDKDGSYFIPGIPSGYGYHIIIQKEKLTFFKEAAISVPAYETIDVGIERFTSLDIEGAPVKDGENGKSIIWKGELVAAPENPEYLWAYFNTKDGCSYIYDGTKWSLLAIKGNDGSSSNGENGKSIIWKGELAAAPENPEYLWAYFNTEDGCSYIYDGSKWDLLVENLKTENYVIISYKSEYGSIPEMKIIRKGTKLSADYFPELTTSENYYFSGWYSSNDLNTKISGDYKIENSTEFIAKWQEYCSVNFVTNSDETIPSVEKIKIGEVLSDERIPVIERYGYDFGGWYTDPELNTSFTSSYSINEKISLYAKWIPKRTRIEYIIYEDDLVLPSDAPEYHVFGTETQLPVPYSKTESEYKLIGWKFENSDYIIKTLSADTLFESIVLVCTAIPKPICEEGEQKAENNAILRCNDNQWVIFEDCGFDAMAIAEYGCIANGSCFYKGTYYPEGLFSDPEDGDLFCYDGNVVPLVTCGIGEVVDPSTNSCVCDTANNYISNGDGYCVLVGPLGCDFHGDIFAHGEEIYENGVIMVCDDGEWVEYDY